jgi:hypothetical protein
MRIALALLVVVAACSKSSAPEDRARSNAEPVGGAPGNPTPDPGTTAGSAPAAPAPETPVEGSVPTHAIRPQNPMFVQSDSSQPPRSELPADLGSNAGKGPPGKITIASKTSFDRTNLSADAVAEAITRDHLAALGACYRGTLARNASVQGKATLALTVKPDGKVDKAKATAPDPALQGCFGKAMATWTFPVPKNADGEPTEAGFQIALALAPQ